MSVHKYSVTPESNTVVGDGSDAVGLQEGMPRQNVNDAMRVIASDIAKNYKDHGALTTSGSGSAYTVLANSSFDNYFVGMSLVVKLHSNCAANATINVNGRGAKTLRMRGPDGTKNVEVNALRTNEIVHIVYNGAQFHVLGAFDDATIRAKIAALETQTASGSVNNAVQLDGQHGSYYRNASNLNAGVIPVARLTGAYDISISGNATTATNADKLDGQHGSYYRNFNNLTNKPTIGDGSITISAGNALDGGGGFSVNQTGAKSITINHANTSNQESVNNTGGTVIQDISLDTYGHLTSLASVNLDNRFLGKTAKAADAEKLDGIHAASFVRSDANDTLTGNYTHKGLNITSRAADHQFSFGYNTGATRNTHVSFYDGQTTRRGYVQALSDRMRFFRDGGAVLDLYGAGDARINGGRITHSGLAWNAIGSLIFARMITEGHLYINQTIAGSKLKPSSGDSDISNATVPGTWRCLGRIEYGGDDQKYGSDSTLFMRIA